MGTAYAQLGNPLQAVRWLTESATSGFPCYSWFLKDPLLTPINSHRSFQELRENLRSEAERRRAKYSRPLYRPF
jgi:hypothetical protein